MAYTNPATKQSPATTSPINGVFLAINLVLIGFGFVWHSLVALCNRLEFLLIPHSFDTEMEEPTLRKVSKLLAVHDHLKDASTFSGRLSAIVQSAEYEPKRKLATFRSTRRNISELRALLELILPMFREFAWNQMVPNAGLNMALLCGLIRRLLQQNESLATQPKTVTNAVTDDYNRWCTVLEVEHLTFGLSDMVEEILFNYRFHQNRTGTLRKFTKLPVELQCMIIDKVPVAFSQQFARDEKKDLRRVWYGVEGKRSDREAFLSQFRRINAFTERIAYSVLERAC